MNSALRVEIDQLSGFLSGVNRSFQHRRPISGKCDNGAIVIRIAGTVQHEHTRHAGNSTVQCLDTDKITPFGKIGDTLYQWGPQPAIAFERTRLNTILPSRIAIAT